MKQLVIDIGNTRNRAAVFYQEEMLDFFEFDELSLDYFSSLKSKYQFDKTLICSVSGKDLSAFENENDVLVVGFYKVDFGWYPQTVANKSLSKEQEQQIIRQEMPYDSQYLILKMQL